MEPKTLVTAGESAYALLDSGAEEKLERFGDIILSRPDPQALWEKRLDADVWKKAHARFERKGKSGVWHSVATMPKDWQIHFGGLTVTIRPTSFKHVGLFPEQLSHWIWADELIRGAGRPISILNLFAYTGGATLSASRAGASLVHLDASKSAVDWAKSNAELSGLSGKPIRWIVDDALSFVTRELKRGSRYDAIIMDPPAFGHGPQDELWKIEEHFLPLLALSKKLLSDAPLFVLLGGYAAGYSSLVFKQNLDSLVLSHGGTIEHGELAIAESDSDRLLPCGIYARYAR